MAGDKSAAKPQTVGKRARDRDDVAAQWVHVSTLTAWVANPRNNDAAVPKVADSIKRFGWGAPILARAENGEVVAGHTRLRAVELLATLVTSDKDVDEWHADALRSAREGMVPVRHGDWSEREAHLLALADNRLNEIAEWDATALAQTMSGYSLPDVDAAGWSSDDLEKMAVDLAGEGGGPGEGEPPELEEPPTPDPPADPVTKIGDVWILGDHRVMCGDSTDPGTVATLMDGQRARLVHADPPYGMGKEADGVLNDNLYRDKLDAFQMRWWRALRPHVADNGSAYIWGTAPDLWRLWYAGGLCDAERLTMRGEIVWAKGSAGAGGISHMGAEGLRQYPNETERCLFFMLGEQGFNHNTDNYWEGWEPIRAELDASCRAMGWGSQDIKRICGVGMYSRWFTRSQWTFIPEEHYRKLKAAAGADAFKREHDELKREHDELKREHDELKRDFYATRAHFDNAHDNMTDVWDFPRVTGEERHGHATPKPVAMMERVMRSSLPDGGLCVEPFGGSGSTLMGAVRTGRRCYTMELSPAYCDVIVQRWEQMTGGKATRASE